MKTVQGDLLLSNYTSEAVAFFLGHRTPAAIIASASLQALLHMTRIHHKQDRSNKKKSLLEEWIVTMCHINFLFSFILSLFMLVISTTAEINIYRGEFKPLAENMFEFLNREFHFELAAIRWCFLGCMLTLLKGLSCHLLLEYGLLKEAKLTQGAMIFSFMLSLMLSLVSYMHSARAIEPWNNWVSMTFDMIKMIWINSLSIEKPLLILSLLSSGLCFGLLTCNVKQQWKAATCIDSQVRKETKGSEKVEDLKHEKGRESNDEVEKKDQ